MTRDSLAGPGPARTSRTSAASTRNQYGSVTAFGVAAGTDGQTIFAGTDTGQAVEDERRRHDLDADDGRARRAGSTPSSSTRRTRSHVYAAFSGYREGDNSANVYETTDGGATWHNTAATCRTRRSR